MREPSLEEIFGSYIAWKAEEDTWFISFMNGSQTLYLLEGQDKALLIDTGYAIGNLRRFVENLTDRPISVINTHFHPDHAGGNGEWESVMMSPGATDDFPSMSATVGDMDALPHPDYKKVYLEDGSHIDLGGRILEVKLAANCHCNSSLYLLDRTKRMLFLGDEIDPAQVLLYDNSKNPEVAKTYCFDTVLKNYKSNLLWVKSHEADFDWLLGNHNGTPLAKSYIDDSIALIDAIYAGTAKIREKLNHPFIEMDPIAFQLCRVSLGKVSFIVNRAQLMALYGKEKP